MESLRRDLEAWSLTLAHYAGILLLVYAAAIDRFSNPGLLPAAIGLILVRGVAGRNGNGDE